MRILALSDIEVPSFHTPQVRERFPAVKLLIGCGDLPYYYLEFLQSVLNVPLFHVRGNHSKVVEESPIGSLDGPLGGHDLHRRVIKYGGLLLAGVEGSGRYREGPYQYTQFGMFGHVLRLIPPLLVNRLRYGRYLDIFVTHASPWGIHDQPDLPHHGIKAFLWFIKTFQPKYHLHGHVHIYNPNTVRETMVGQTKVVNTYGYREIDIEVEAGRSNNQKGGN